jgi:hypothetical protein
MWDDLVERAEEGDRIIADLRADLADRDAKLATITAELGRLLALANKAVIPTGPCKLRHKNRKSGVG